MEISPETRGVMFMCRARSKLVPGLCDKPRDTRAKSQFDGQDHFVHNDVANQLFPCPWNGLTRKCTEYDLRPGVVIREIRIQTAVKAMEKDGISMAEAAKRVGYSPNHLRRLLDEERPIVQEI